MSEPPIRLLQLVYRPLVRRAARQILEGRWTDPERPEAGRWLRRDVDAFLARTWREVDTLLPEAALATLPNFGNRHNVFLAVVTTAAYRALLDQGVERGHAMLLVGDVGWKIYAWLLQAASLPFRLARRSRAGRLEATLRALMRFPFAAPGPPGYQVETRFEPGRVHTHWTHCPPLAFVRRVVAAHGDRGEVEAFYRSWCLYDWPAADLLVDDGRHGHYRRPHTLSRGDSVCDMCWYARLQGDRDDAAAPPA
jgi:hypothetical protein